MEEKGKSRVLIYIIVVLVSLILIMAVFGIMMYKNLTEKEKLPGHDAPILPVEDMVQSENLVAQTEQQLKVDEQIQIQDNIASKNIMLNGKVTQVRLTVTSNKESQDDYRKTYINHIEVQIGEKKLQSPIEDIEVILEKDDSLNISNIVKNITIIKGEDNKDYIVLTLQKSNPYTSSTEYIYIINENGNILGKFVNNMNEGVILENHLVSYIQINEQHIKEYEAIAPTKQNEKVLKEWKWTIKDDKLTKKLEKTYSKGQFELSGKSW